PDSGVGDGAIDTVTVEGTNDDDVAVVVGDASGVAVIGPAAPVNIVGAQAANDQPTGKGVPGDDTIGASRPSAGPVRLPADGGDGNDDLLGSGGDDTLVGGPGDDILIGGAGTDVLNAAPGDDVIIPD